MWAKLHGFPTDSPSLPAAEGIPRGLLVFAIGFGKGH